jgi:tetraacyldisaccharide 4'-kinase
MAVSKSAERSILDVMSGRRSGPAAALARTGLSIVEPFYAGAMVLRNLAFDAGLHKAHRLPRPVISVGNITTGGTGKTPVVAWIADQLRAAGRHPAILLRGYKSISGKGAPISDEQQLLTAALNPPGGATAAVPVVADPDRVRGSAIALGRHPEIDVFLLDDGFQHRRVARDLDVVLISATNPFGYGHVLPRGLRREPMRGLRRAGVFLVTHANEAAAEQLRQITQTLAHHNAAAPVFRADHTLTGFREFNPAAPDRPIKRSMSDLGSVRYFAACGIGQPESFLAALKSRHGAACIGHRFFPDHHAFTDADLLALHTAARGAGADVLIVTEKDWVKLAGLPSLRETCRIWRAQLGIHFWESDAEQLRQRIMAIRFKDAT